MRRTYLGVLLVVCGSSAACMSSGCASPAERHPAGLSAEGSPRLTAELKNAAEAARQALEEVLFITEELAAAPRRLTSAEAGGQVAPLGWELSRRTEAVGDAAATAGGASPGASLAMAKLITAVRRLDAASKALTRNLPEGVGSLADCREALDAAITAVEAAIQEPST